MTKEEEIDKILCDWETDSELGCDVDRDTILKISEVIWGKEYWKTRYEGR